MRLVAAVLAAAFVPVGLAVWAFARTGTHDGPERADLQLTASLGLATARLSDALSLADRRAAALASLPGVQRALRGHDRRGLALAVRRHPGTQLAAGSLRIGGRPAGPAIARTVRVAGPDGPIGSATVFVRLDAPLRRSLSEAAAAAGPTRVAVVTPGDFRFPQPGRPAEAELEGMRFRALTGNPLPGGRGARLAALVPSADVGPSGGDRTRRALIAGALTLGALGALAWAVAPALARSRAARRGVALVGHALAATHDADALLPVILNTTVEATGAAGGRLIDNGTEIARAGRVPGDERVALHLGIEDDPNGARLLLYPPPDGFSDEAEELAGWLAAQAAIALENARLHAVVKEQAVTDPLTGLANRRRFIAALETELHRAARFDAPVALVLADIDNFKRVNDTWGHAAGDDVLRAFADALRSRLRDIDLPARLGGEEFAVILPGTDVDGGRLLAERLRHAVGELRVSAGGGDRSITASFGVAASTGETSPDELLAASDSALYAAKLRGKNRVVAETGAGR